MKMEFPIERIDDHPSQPTAASLPRCTCRKPALRSCGAGLRCHPIHLSADLLALERQLDRNILNRAAGRHVVSTPLGIELVDRARAALNALEAVTEAALTSREPMAGSLHMGVILTIGPFLLPSLMPALREALPRLRLYLREDTTARLVDRFAEHRLTCC